MVEKKIKAVGSRAEVFHNNAKHTSSGLKSSDLFMKNGRIKSKKASRSAKKSNNLRKAGYHTKKGQFGVFQKK